MDELIHDIVTNQKLLFQSNKTKSLDFRLKQLRKLENLMINHENLLFEALKKDLNKSKTEAYMTEIGIVLSEIKHMIKYLNKYSKPKVVKTPLAYVGSKSYIVSEPLGVVLIISPWNYPIQLTLIPLIGAIAAGNCCVIKTSQMSYNTSQALSSIINNNFDKNYIRIIKNKPTTNSDILEENFDHIFFTGSPKIGKVVMSAASKTLTPVTLELGGKSPCIVNDSTDLVSTCKKICFGKFCNAGQTCVAPDYILINKNIKTEFIKCLKDTIIKFYGCIPKESNDLPRIINEKHFDRLNKLLENQHIIFGGILDRKERFISPTLLDNVDSNSRVMKEEIFGPILPIIEYNSITELINFITDRPKPLALYIFSKNTDFQNKIINKTSSGGICINDTLIHMTTPTLPFGGVGESGMGNYHGKASFDTFSHKKSILKSSSTVDTKIYPPYFIALSKLKKLLKFL